jgi:hypothetical protein
MIIFLKTGCDYLRISRVFWQIGYFNSTFFFIFTGKAQPWFGLGVCESKPSAHTHGHGVCGLGFLF